MKTDAGETRQIEEMQQNSRVIYAPLACDCYERGSNPLLAGEYQNNYPEQKTQMAKIQVFPLEFGTIPVVRAIHRKSKVCVDVHLCPLRGQEIITITNYGWLSTVKHRKQLLDQVEILLSAVPLGYERRGKRPKITERAILTCLQEYPRCVPKQYNVAQCLGVADSTLSEWLKKEKTNLKEMWGRAIQARFGIKKTQFRKMV